MTQEELNQNLLFAITTNNVEDATKFINEGADVDAKDQFGTPVLYLAIGFNQSETVKLLLDNGANIAVTNQYGNPLDYAILLNHPEIVKLLVSKGTTLHLDVNNSNYVTPEMQKIIDIASIVDHIFEGGKLINQEAIENIDSDIFLSRYKHHLSTKGYVKSYQQHIDDLNQCCPYPSKEKDKLIKSIRQDQSNFDMECASIFHTIFGFNNPTPIATILELLKESGNKEIPESAMKIFEFYEKNSWLNVEGVTNYINNDNPSQNEMDEFKNAITNANIKIFTYRLPSIFLKCLNDDSCFKIVVEFLENCVLPIEVIKEIDEYFKLSASGNLFDGFDVLENLPDESSTLGNFFDESYEE